MDTAMAILITIVATVGVMSVGFVIMKSRQSGNAEIPWDKIRPILSEMFIEAVKLMQAKEAGYQGIEDYSVSYVKRKVNEADFLLQAEKDILTDDFIRSIIAPRLKELYYKESASVKRV